MEQEIVVSRDGLEKGDRLFEFDPNHAVYEQRESGGLYLCSCKEWRWECYTDLGVTYCLQKCVAWDCRPAPSQTAER